MIENRPEQRGTLLSIGGSPNNLVAKIMTPEGNFEEIQVNSEVDCYDFEQVATDLELDLPGPRDYTQAFELKQKQGVELEVI